MIFLDLKKYSWKKNLSLEEIWGERRHFEEFWIGDLLSKA